MELLQLRYFKEACESENFSAVANKYMVPQPSISKTIKKLENELGVQLFDRNGKKISLNGNGRYFYEKIKRQRYKTSSDSKQITVIIQCHAKLRKAIDISLHSCS